MTASLFPSSRTARPLSQPSPPPSSRFSGGQISSTALLQQLGFHPIKMHEDVTALFVYLAVVLLIAFICLVKVVKERK